MTKETYVSAPGDNRQDADPVVDIGAVLTAMQDQLDDLTGTVAAQQRTIDELVRLQQQLRGSSGP